MEERKNCRSTIAPEHSPSSYNHSVVNLPNPHLTARELLTATGYSFNHANADKTRKGMGTIDTRKAKTGD